MSRETYKMIFNLIIWIIIIYLVLTLMGNGIIYHELPCKNSTLSEYSSCKFSETTGGGFFGPPQREIYLCDGMRLEKKCFDKSQEFTFNPVRLIKEVENAK